MPSIKLKNPNVDELLSLKELEAEALKRKIKVLLSEVEILRKKSKEYVEKQKNKDEYLDFLQEFNIIENEKSEMINEIKNDLEELKKDVFVTGRIKASINKIIKKLDSYK